MAAKYVTCLRLCVDDMIFSLNGANGPTTSAYSKETVYVLSCLLGSSTIQSQSTLFG